MISTRLLQMSFVYLIIGIIMGVVMGITQNFSLAPVHAHINLLGWATMALMALIYRGYPDAAATTLARIHFWLHAVFFPVFMICLTILLLGNPGIGPVLGISATITGLGVILYCINMLRFVRGPASSAR